jgi:O-antigen/teichoic acid export membrane protein
MVSMMSENILNKLLKQVSMYFSSGVLVALCGFLSFPIWTRVFSESEYGKMSIAFVTLGLIVVLAKFGIQRATIRFYSEFKEKKRDLDITYYYTTSFIGVTGVSIIMAFIFLLFIEINPSLQNDIVLKKILRLLSLLIIFEPLNNIFLSFLRAEQNVKFYSIIRISRRYVKLLVTLLFVLVFNQGLVGFFIGCMLTDATFAFFLLFIFLRQRKIRFNHISFLLLKESISYGLPLIGLELSALLLMTGDRYLLQYFLGSAAVGIYSVSTTFTGYAVDFFSEPLRLAAMPLVMSIWEKNGKADTQKFLSSVFMFYFIIGIPIIFAFSFIGHDLIVLVASNKFVEGSTILPFIVVGYVIHKANFLYGAGLYLKKKTVVLSIIIFSSAILNILLNIILIPAFGLRGAAMTTLLAYIFETILLIKYSFRSISFKIPVFKLLKYVAISIVMVGVMLSINNLGSWQTVIRVIAGFLTYIGGILIFETDVREKAGLLLAKVLQNNF